MQFAIKTKSVKNAYRHFFWSFKTDVFSSRLVLLYIQLLYILDSGHTYISAAS